MKNIYLIFLSLIFSSGTVWSQSIKYEKSLEEAQKLSREQNKPMCILVTMQPPAVVSNFMYGLEEPAVVAKFNENFINFKTDRADTASAKIVRKYSLTSFPAFLFVDSKGGVIFKRFGNLPPPMFSAMLDEAIVQSKGKSLADYDSEYVSGDRNRALLKDYINKRISAGITKNAELIENYVNTLAVADLNNYGEILFILKAGPLVDGRAYALVYTNKRMADSVYKRELYDVRVAINNRIIENSMASAIATKNINRVYAISSFTQRTWTGVDRLQGMKNASVKLLQYYSGIKDTSNYLRAAADHYDRHYMNISVDSIRRLDAKTQERARSNANEQAALATPPGANMRSVSYSFASNTFATDLNNGAWSVYATGTKNPLPLSKAMLWSKRAIELNPIAGFYDTLAHILYRLGFYAEAETTQLKAIEKAKIEKSSDKVLQAELSKMKSRSL